MMKKVKIENFTHCKNPCYVIYFNSIFRLKAKNVMNINFENVDVYFLLQQKILNEIMNHKR